MSSTPAADGSFYPVGYHAYVEQLPFLGCLTCLARQLEAGSWQEILLDYEVGSAGLADGAWIKITFKFYSDWALFQCEDPTAANYLSAEYQARPCLEGESPATVQELKVRFDQKGHERPFQKAVIIDVIDGYLKPGDHILVRLGDRRAGGPGTRIQTFVEAGFRFRAYIDPVGTSRFAAIPGDVVIDILPGPPAALVAITPRLVRVGEKFSLRLRAEDRWGNTCRDLTGRAIRLQGPSGEQILPLPDTGWAVARSDLVLEQSGETVLRAELTDFSLECAPIYLAAQKDLPFPRAFWADLHVHSNHTVGTNSTEYNFAYGRDVAGLDVLGYTANDFNISESDWQEDVKLCSQVSLEGEFLCYPGTEWCGNSAAGGDRNVIFLGEDVLFPTGPDGQSLRSFEWNDQMQGNALIPGAWPVDRLWKAYLPNPGNYLMMPHVGGRRAILDWHQPQLERLVEVGSAWGQFDWFYREAIRRGYRLGVAANGDEHRGRCGGGVPGTAVFGVKGGLTGIVAPSLTRSAINRALRARHTWATTGERSVALLWSGPHLQGDHFVADAPVTLHYHLLGDAGWDSLSAWDHRGRLWNRNLQQEAGYSTNRLRIRWGGARIQDRYRWAEWRGVLRCTHASIQNFRAQGFEHPEQFVRRAGALELAFRSDTYGDSDAIELEVSNLATAQFDLQVQIGAFDKLGSPLRPNPHRHCPESHWRFSGSELIEQGQLRQELGGEGLFLAAERLSAAAIPREIRGSFVLEPLPDPLAAHPVYLSAQQIDGSRVWTSPLFIEPAQAAPPS